MVLDLVTVFVSRAARFCDFHQIPHDFQNTVVEGCSDEQPGSAGSVPHVQSRVGYTSRLSGKVLWQLDSVE